MGFRITWSASSAARRTRQWTICSLPTFSQGNSSFACFALAVGSSCRLLLTLLCRPGGWMAGILCPRSFEGDSILASSWSRGGSGRSVIHVPLTTPRPRSSRLRSKCWRRLTSGPPPGSWRSLSSWSFLLLSSVFVACHTVLLRCNPLCLCLSGCSFR